MVEIPAINVVLSGAFFDGNTNSTRRLKCLI